MPNSIKVSAPMVGIQSIDQVILSNSNIAHERRNKLHKEQFPRPYTPLKPSFLEAFNGQLLARPVRRTQHKIKTDEQLPRACLIAPQIWETNSFQKPVPRPVQTPQYGPLTLNHTTIGAFAEGDMDLYQSKPQYFHAENKVTKCKDRQFNMYSQKVKHMGSTVWQRNREQQIVRKKHLCGFQPDSIIEEKPKKVARRRNSLRAETLSHKPLIKFDIQPKSPNGDIINNWGQAPITFPKATYASRVGPQNVFSKHRRASEVLQTGYTDQLSLEQGEYMGNAAPGAQKAPGCTDYSPNKGMREKKASTTIFSTTQRFFNKNLGNIALTTYTQPPESTKQHTYASLNRNFSQTNTGSFGKANRLEPKSPSQLSRNSKSPTFKTLAQKTTSFGSEFNRPMTTVQSQASGTMKGRRRTAFALQTDLCQLNADSNAQLGSGMTSEKNLGLKAQIMQQRPKRAASAMQTHSRKKPDALRSATPTQNAQSSTNTRFKMPQGGHRFIQEYIKDQEESTPGPGYYKTEIGLLLPQEQQIKMSTAERFRDGQQSPGPYDTVEAYKFVMKQSGAATIPKGERVIEPKLYGSKNSKAYVKGIHLK